MKRIATLFLACLLTLNLFGCSKKLDPAAQLVMDEITELTEGGEVSIEKIEKAKERYNSLTDEQKSQVTNYADLLKLEDAYDSYVEEALAQEEYKKTHYGTSEFLRITQICPGINVNEQVEFLDDGSIKVRFDDVENADGEHVYDIYRTSYLEKNFVKEEYEKWTFSYTDSQGNVLKDIHRSNYVEFVIHMK